MKPGNIAHDLVGVSPAIQKTIKFIATVAGKDVTVLIGGESGTGKELVARAIHRNSMRSDGPFVALNCAAVPEELLESELFGYEKGAFTHAAAQKKGQIETAQGGTLFLDEIGDMKLSMQAKLLRVLQERRVQRLGALGTIAIDIRLITATHRDLKAMVAAETFRQDLYYRIRVVSVELLPLRERREDIMPLALNFLTKYSEKHERDVQGISEAAERILTTYDWPGNVRELENSIEAAVVIGSGELVDAQDLPSEIVLTPPKAVMAPLRGLRRIMDEVERHVVHNALVWTKGCRRQASELLGIHEVSLYRRIEKFNLTHLVKGGAL